MTKYITDVDIDVFGRDDILGGLVHTIAGISRDTIEKHPTGVYFQNIPKNPETNVSNIDHKLAAQHGYFKIDFLNVNFYEGVKSEDHLIRLMAIEPDWDLFQYEEITDQLFHLKGYSYLLKKYKPKSVEDLAAILAIIRPSKSYLQQHSWETILANVWVKDASAHDVYQFKRGHGISYALAVVVHLNLIIEQLSKHDTNILDLYRSRKNAD